MKNMNMGITLLENADETPTAPGDRFDLVYYHGKDGLYLWEPNPPACPSYELYLASTPEKGNTPVICFLVTLSEDQAQAILGSAAIDQEPSTLSAPVQELPESVIPAMTGGISESTMLKALAIAQKPELIKELVSG